MKSLIIGACDVVTEYCLKKQPDPNQIQTQIRCSSKPQQTPRRLAHMNQGAMHEYAGVSPCHRLKYIAIVPTTFLTTNIDMSRKASRATTPSFLIATFAQPPSITTPPSDSLAFPDQPNTPAHSAAWGVGEKLHARFIVDISLSPPAKSSVATCIQCPKPMCSRCQDLSPYVL